MSELNLDEENNLLNEADITWWSSLSTEDAESIKKMLQAQNMSTLRNLSSNGVTSNNLFRQLYKSHATYEMYPLNTELIKELKQCGFEEDDFPLPIQLSNRVGNYFLNLQENSKEYTVIKSIIPRISSFNWLVRSLIKNKVLK